MGEQRKVWTDEEDQAARDMIAEGMTAAQIGEELGRTPQSVKARMNVLGVTRRREERPQGEPAPEIVHEMLRAAVYAGRIAAAHVACKLAGITLPEGALKSGIPTISVTTRPTRDGWEAEMPEGLGVKAIRVVRR